MNVIVCVASHRADYLRDFIIEIQRCSSNTVGGVRLLAIENFIGDIPECESMAMSIRNELYTRKGNPEKRPYNQIIQEKVEFISEYADDDTAVWLADVDYACNPWALKVMQTIFEENPEVNYLSLLRGPGVPEEVVNVKLSGLLTYFWPSCMGGSIMTRWSVFKHHVKEFFAQGPTSHSFDGPVGVSFWPFLRERYGIENPVCTIGHPSLVQHCNLGSVYGYDKGPKGHMYAVNYDARAQVLKTTRAE